MLSLNFSIPYVLRFSVKIFFPPLVDACIIYSSYCYHSFFYFLPLCFTFASMYVSICLFFGISCVWLFSPLLFSLSLSLSLLFFLVFGVFSVTLLFIYIYHLGIVSSFFSLFSFPLDFVSFLTNLTFFFPLSAILFFLYLKKIRITTKKQQNLQKNKQNKVSVYALSFFS